MLPEHDNNSIGPEPGIFNTRAQSNVTGHLKNIKMRILHMNQVFVLSGLGQARVRHTQNMVIIVLYPTQVFLALGLTQCVRTL